MDYIPTSVISNVSIEVLTRIIKEETGDIFSPGLIICGETSAENYWEILKKAPTGQRMKLFCIAELPPNMWILCDEKLHLCGVSMPD